MKFCLVTDIKSTGHRSLLVWDIINKLWLKGHTQWNSKLLNNCSYSLKQWVEYK